MILKKIQVTFRKSKKTKNQKKKLKEIFSLIQKIIS